MSSINNRKLKAEEFKRLTIDEFKSSDKTNIIVVLDNIRSQHNIGSIFRTCDAFKIKEIHLCGITAIPPSVDIHKTALGAEYSVNWHYFKETKLSIEKLKQENYIIYSIEQSQNSLSLNNLSLNKEKKYALVLGHEVNGVEQKIIDLSDNCIEIPQYGTKHSMNVSVAGGIVIWEFFKLLQ